MNGRLYIDGKDAYDNFGLTIGENGYNGLLTYHPLKKVDTNDWPEKDGIEVDLSNPVLDTMEFSIEFYCIDSYKSGDFIELLSDGAYHKFDFREIGRVLRLRMVAQSNKKMAVQFEAFALQFANDFPLSGYVYREPFTHVRNPKGYEFDGRDLSEYGVMVLLGSDDEIQKSPAVKKNMLTNIAGRAGADYDGAVVVFQAKDVTLKLLMVAPNMDEFWQNYDALLYDLTKPRERQFYTENMGLEYPCYYKSASVTKFSVRNEVLCEFSITLVFTSFRIGATEYILASEDGERICTEDGYLIDLKY